MKRVICFSAVALLSACATSPSTYQAEIADLQASVSQVEAYINQDPRLMTEAAYKAEAALNIAMAVLARAPTPANATAVLQNFQLVSDAMPPNVISADHRLQIDEAIAVARLVVTLSGASAPASQ
jgi:hypothetical protein